MLEFEGNRWNTCSGITERHFTRVAEQPKSRNIGDGVNATYAASRLEFTQSFGSGTIELRHRGYGSIKSRLWQAIFLQCRGEHTRANRLGEHKCVIGLARRHFSRFAAGRQAL